MRERVLLTGASSGIGLELAKCFAAEGCDVVIVARRAERLLWLAEELKGSYGVDATVLTEDLADREAPARLAAALESQDKPIDVVVNNAGFGMRGRFHELSLDRQLAMLQLNITSLVELTHRLLAGIHSRGRGGVLNVASTAAFQPGPNMAVYYASKAFVLSFTEAVREGLRDSGLHICCLCPGPTKSEFAELADMDDSRLFRRGAMTAADVARAGHRGYRANRAVTVPGLANKLGAQASRLLPRALMRRLVARLQ